MRYFLVENFLITTIGVVLGAILTVLFNIWLVEMAGFPRVELPYVIGGMLVLWVIGLLAVYGPARRACNVPPVVATRTI